MKRCFTRVYIVNSSGLNVDHNVQHNAFAEYNVWHNENVFSDIERFLSLNFNILFEIM